VLLPISPRPAAAAAAAAAAASAMAKRSRDVDEEGDQGPLFVSDDEGGEGGDDSGPARKGAGAGKAAGGAAGKKRKMTPAARKRAKRRKEKEVALAKGYTTATVFVGQLPYKATAAQLKEYFAHRGILNTKVRLRKDRNTNKSLGTAFIDLEDKHQIPNALRLHHSMFQGRQINVERTVGGGGNSEKRTTKLKMLRDVQQNQSQKDMDELLATMTSEAEENDDPERAAVLRGLDDRVKDALVTFPSTVVRTILEEYTETMAGKAVDSKDVTNANAYIMGMLKRHRQQLKDGTEDSFKKGPRGGGGGRGGGGRGRGRGRGGGRGRGRGRGVAGRSGAQR
jgi:nucleolar protein 6